MGRWWNVAQVVVARRTIKRFGMNKICCVTVDVEAHVDRSLLGADFIEFDEHGGVDGARDVGKGSLNALHTCDAVFIVFMCGHGIGRILHLGPIHRREPFVGRVFKARGYAVLEDLQGFADGVGHGNVDLIVRVVPIDGKYAVLAARWVDGDGVILLDGVEGVVGVVGGEKIDSKVIYSEGEGGR